MKNHIPRCLAAAMMLAPLTISRAADDAATTKEEKKQMRVLAAPEREHRFFAQKDSERRDKVEKETVAFLGVETAPVSATTSAQLGLPRGTGLVVNHIVPKSAAAGALNEHDILLKLDDQILIETRQLSVLIRNHKEGDEVVVTYLRGGQKATAKIKLGKTEVTKTSSIFGSAVLPFGYVGAGNRFELFTPPVGTDAERADVDRVLSMIQRSPTGDPVRIQIDRSAGPGLRAIAVHTGNSNMVFSDDDGSLELTTKDGVKTLVAKNAKGEELFAGAVTTPEERGAMPAAVRARLEKLEGLHDITFHTDGNFKGAELKVVRPRGIALPFTHQLPPPEHQPIFY